VGIERRIAPARRVTLSDLAHHAGAPAAWVGEPL